jgi:protein-L-isoaspartate O-methyltransferase
VNEPNASSRDYFEAQYHRSPDPWNFAGSAYESERYRATLAALGRLRYRRAYEPGCSVGVLTAELAPRCDYLLACDIAATAVSRARNRCKEFPHVDIVQGDVAQPPRAEPFDLIVFSEIGYYARACALRRTALALADRLTPDGEFVAVHWLGHSADHVLHGDEVHAILAANLPCAWTGGSRHPGFRIDTWRRSP